MKFINNLYTLIEIGINNNYTENQLKQLSLIMNKKNLNEIREIFPELTKFLPYCNWYIINNKNVLAMSAYIYDMYKNIGLLPDLENYDMDSSIEKLEHWQYINPYMFEINPNTGFEFAEKLFDCDVWNLLLSGNARMNYYQNENVTLEQRIKYAIVEYMLKRPQFFTTEDFVENKLLVKKYKGGK